MEEVAVVGVVEANERTRRHAYVVLRDRQGGGTELAEALRAFVRERLESYRVPREFVFMDELPRTHLGKVDRGKFEGGEVGEARWRRLS